MSEYPYRFDTEVSMQYVVTDIALEKGTFEQQIKAIFEKEKFEVDTFESVDQPFKLTIRCKIESIDANAFDPRIVEADIQIRQKLNERGFSVSSFVNKGEWNVLIYILRNISKDIPADDCEYLMVNDHVPR
jgi:hypothetical protein